MALWHVNINIQTLIALFFLTFFVVLGVFGFLLFRFEFLDGKEFHFSRPLGGILMIACSILTLAGLLMLLYVRATMA